MAYLQIPPLPHSSCFELSSTTVTRRIRQVWPTPQRWHAAWSGTPPSNVLSRSQQEHIRPWFGMLSGTPRPLSFHTYLPSLCVSILKIPEMLLYHRLRQGLELALTRELWLFFKDPLGWQMLTRLNCGGHFTIYTNVESFYSWNWCNVMCESWLVHHLRGHSIPVTGNVLRNVIPSFPTLSSKCHLIPVR